MSNTESVVTCDRAALCPVATPLKGGAWRKASMVMLAAGLVPDVDGSGRDTVETITKAQTKLEAQRHLGAHGGLL